MVGSVAVLVPAILFFLVFIREMVGCVIVFRCFCVGGLILSFWSWVACGVLGFFFDCSYLGCF